MSSRAFRSFAHFAPSRFLRIAVIVAFVGLSVVPLYTKEPNLSAIELYSDPSGPSYVQLTSFLINGKTELRVCGSSPKISKPEYGKLAKVTLNPGDEIEEKQNGELILTQSGNSVCVVPSNLKLEKSSSFSPAELASRAALQGSVLPSGPTTIATPPPFAPGVKIVLVTAPDVELAEYLRADHTPLISLWQDYLAKYATSPHAANARKSFASLLVSHGQENLAAYRKSLPGPPRAYSDLKTADLRSEQALKLIPDYELATQLNDEVHAEVSKLIDEGRHEVGLYQEARKGRTPGYVHLVAAQDLVNACADTDPHFEPTLSLQTETANETNSLETSLRKAESLLASKKYDESLAAIQAYTFFADEAPRIAAIVNTTYQLHFDVAQQAAEAKDWNLAVAEFQKALNAKSTKTVEAALKNAGAQLEATNNRKAADEAIAQSQSYEELGNYVEAYEILADLPPARRELVANEISRLTPLYVQSAPKTATELAKAHEPITGLADEVAIQSAYDYLQRAYNLSQDPLLKDRMDALGDKLSDYYLTQARRFMQKPLGTGAGLAWSFLSKALQYKASNLDAVRDERTKAESAYQIRSRLSVGVVFRDQTSRRDSAGFAEQLADALATGLEASGFSGKVIRPGETPVFDPNFQLVGDVIEHHPTKVAKSQPKESHYRVGLQDMPNVEWNKLNREYEAAKDELQTLQQTLSGISARGKKKEIAEANDKVKTAQKKVMELANKLDSIPKSSPIDVIKAYTYTERTIVVTAIVQLQFRIKDLSQNQVAETVPVKREKTQEYQVLENVKPEDTDGVKALGTEPDENQLLTDDENDARDALTKAVIANVAQLPAIVFKKGAKQAEDGDEQGAAESFILYLNSTPAGDTADRLRAENFLLAKFNIRWRPPNSSPDGMVATDTRR